MVGSLIVKDEYASAMVSEEKVEDVVDCGFWMKWDAGIQWAREFIGAKFSEEWKPEGLRRWWKRYWGSWRVQ